MRIKKSIKKILEMPIDFILNIYIYLNDNSRSNLLLVLDKIRIENKNISIEANLNSVYNFYHNDLEKYCLKNNFNIIRELEIRKNELEHNFNNLISIFTGVITGILATIIVNCFHPLFIVSSEDIINNSFKNDSKYFLLGLILLVSCILFFPIIKYGINIFRKNREAELQIIDQYELKLINDILIKKTYDMLHN